MNKVTLRARQKRFIDEYLTDLNASRAAIAAGYSKRTAAQAGWEVLRNPKVAAEISRRQRLLSFRHEVTIENVLSELAQLAFSNIADFYSVSEAGHLDLDFAALRDPKKAAAISQMEVAETKDGQVVKIRLFDKRAALGDLGRHLGLSTDRLEVRLEHDKPKEELSVRELALAALALIAEASHDHERGERGPLLINGPPEALNNAKETTRGRPVSAGRSLDEDNFDLDI